MGRAQRPVCQLWLKGSGLFLEAAERMLANAGKAKAAAAGV